MQNFSSMLAGQIPCNQVIKSIALGKFDGLHLGHRRLLTQLDSGGAVLIIANDEQSEVLTSIQDRLNRLPRAYSINLSDVAQLSGEEFLAGLASALPHLERIVVGYDFRFGKGRLYGAEDLSSLCGYEVIIVPKVCYGEVPLHASVIKDLVRHGDISVANAMLGWCYRIVGEVVRGQGLGRRELYPTINMRSQGYVLPANGVYATRLEGLAAVSFFGRRLSTDGNYAIESHILQEGRDVCGELDKSAAREEAICGGELGRCVTLELHKKIRENRHFTSLISLKEQIARDISQAREILGVSGNHRVE